ncbi:hypothetical protein BHU72_05145 [Desulfuribacillus stibiiarsenatis]|uniref:Uncharacterized protein n=1 Tax=Desulfuribacillus stibiiarsenatis TaxID=1390249 RepID=A0A1E5L643_9FIRM|nr:hypothetical protein [Desulfuribacillus stibiiarsenatis]OEH85473.1 hypothetical protein BHU72_05145 [Desulfuribacillus stibiiarsenatis]
MNKNITSYSLAILFGIVAFIFYHFVVFPLFLDYGIYGVLGTVFLIAVIIAILPKEKRLAFCFLMIGYLLLVRGLYRVAYKPTLEQLLAFVVLTTVFLITTKILAKQIKLRFVLVLCVVGGLLFQGWTQEELFFAKKFRVIYESPTLFNDTNVDYFPLKLVDITGDGQLEIVTQGLLPQEISESELAKQYTSPGRAPMQLEPSRYLVFQHRIDDGGFSDAKEGFIEIGKDQRYQQSIWNEVQRDYIGFPYYTSEWASDKNFIHRFSEIRKSLLDRGMLQMDFFYQLEDDLTVEIGDNLRITSSLFPLLERDSEKNVLMTDGSVDSVDNSVGKSVENSGVYELLIPQVDRLHVINQLLPFGQTPFAALALSTDTVEKQQLSWQQTVEKLAAVDNLNGLSEQQQTFVEEMQREGARFLGTAKLTQDDVASGEPEFIFYRDGLEIYQWGGAEWQLVAMLSPDMLREVADGEFLFANVTGDARDEILLSGTPSQVLRLTENPSYPMNDSNGGPYPYQWEQLWVAQDDVFRFEHVKADGEIIALSQSYMRNEPRRYLTGYRVEETMENIPGASKSSQTYSYEMKPIWRTNNTVINVNVGDVTGDGTDEIVASYYQQHRFVVLKEHGMPVQEGAWGLTLLSIMGIAWYRLRGHRKLSPLRHPNRKETLDDLSTTPWNQKGSTQTNQISDEKGIANTRIMLILIMVSITLLTAAGCSHPSAEGLPKTITYDIDSGQLNGQLLDADNKVTNRTFTNSEWEDFWNEAVQFTEVNGKRFWYSGWVVTKVQKRRTTSMYDGIVVREVAQQSTEKDTTLENSRTGILVNARLLGRPFRYYEAGEHIYLHEEGNWQRMQNESGFPVDWLARYDGQRLSIDEPFIELLQLTNTEQLIKAPQIIGRERILGNWCDKVILTVVGPNNAQMDWTIWVGEDDPYIYQYETKTLMPVPGAGMMQQTVYFRFWNYNDTSIVMSDPLLIEKQIVNRELLQIEDIEKVLADENMLAELTGQEIRLLELRLAILLENVAKSPVSAD